MNPRYELSLSAEAETSYRDLRSRKSAKGLTEALLRILNEVLLRSPMDDRFRLAGKLSGIYRLKRDGLLVDYLVSRLQVKIICIAPVEGTQCDAVGLLNSLVQSGTHEQLLRDLGLPEPLIRMGPQPGFRSLPQ